MSHAAIANASIAAAKVRDSWVATGANHPLGAGYHGAGGGESHDMLCVSGGSVWAGSGVSNTYAYDPVANSWTAKTAHPGGGVTEMGGGSFQDKAVVAGGTFGGSDLTDHRWFDAVANTFTSKAAFSLTVRYPGIGNLADTYIDSTGAYGSGSYSNYHSLYDASANTWTAKANNPNGNVYGGQCMGNLDATTYAWQFGGFNGTIVVLSIQRWDRVANTWTNIGLTGKSGWGTYGGRCVDALDGIGYSIGHAGLEEHVIEVDIDAPNDAVTKEYNAQINISGNNPTSARINGKIYVHAPTQAPTKILTPRVTPRAIKRLFALIASA